MDKNECQILIIGAGVIGLAVACDLVRRGAENILILEKEPCLGRHASGRNSGVLHAGMYYTPDTLKAKYCVEGNRLMKEFCREKGLTLNETGKVILAPGSAEIESLHELKRRADLCGARASLIDDKKLHEIEPYAAPSEEALFSPDTAVIRPIEVLEALAEELIRSGKAAISYGASFQGLFGERQARTSKGVVRFERLVNAAGAHADRIAHQFGLAREYRILPFKGTYKKLVESRTPHVRGNIYPVPDLRTPFLGIHLTRTADDEILVGPTAVPALGRENYRLLEGLSGETAVILLRDAALLFQNESFRRVAFTEPKKYFRRYVLREARKLMPSLRLQDLAETEHVGIRPMS
jgi:L-2-hydroxyglutarate oxidase LhgO